MAKTLRNAPDRGMRGAAGGGEGLKPSGVCKNSCTTLHAGFCMQRFMQKGYARVYSRVMTGIQHAAQGCGGFKRSAHSAVPTLVAWRFGGNEGLEGLERNRDW